MRNPESKYAGDAELAPVLPSYFINQTSPEKSSTRSDVAAKKTAPKGSIATRGSGDVGPYGG